MGLGYPDTYLDAREVEKLTNVAEKRACQECVEKQQVNRIAQEGFAVP